jgi:hypothetical protein
VNGRFASVLRVETLEKRVQIVAVHRVMEPLYEFVSA